MSKKIVNKELPVVQHIDPLNEKVLCGKFEEIQSLTSATPRYLTKISPWNILQSYFFVSQLISKSFKVFLHRLCWSIIRVEIESQKLFSRFSLML